MICGANTVICANSLICGTSTAICGNSVLCGAIAAFCCMEHTEQLNSCVQERETPVKIGTNKGRVTKFIFLRHVRYIDKDEKRVPFFEIGCPEKTWYGTVLDVYTQSSTKRACSLPNVQCNLVQCMFRKSLYGHQRSASFVRTSYFKQDGMESPQNCHF